VPSEFRGRPGGADEYVKLLTDWLIPEVTSNGLAEYCDVFCDRGAFSRAHQNKFWPPARSTSLFHGCTQSSLRGTGATQLAVELGACELRSPGAYQHQRHSRSGKIEDRGDTLARLRFPPWPEQYAPARKLIEAGAIVALATDYNRNEPTMSIP